MEHWEEIQKAAEKAKKKIQDVDRLLAIYCNGDYTRLLQISVTNIFEVQDALGGEIIYDSWGGGRSFDGRLNVNGVLYCQVGLTEEEIQTRTPFISKVMKELGNG